MNYTTIVINDKEKVFVYPDGHSTWSNGTELLPSGGKEAVLSYFNFTTYNIDGVDYKVFGNGTSTYTNGTVILEKGGYPALIKYLSKDKEAQVIEIEGETYYIYSNGTVTDGNGKVIVEEGGKEALIKKVYGDYYVYIRDGQKYHIHANGTSSYANGTVIFSEGGRKKLDDYLDSLKPQIVQIGNTTVYVHKNGTVTKITGEVITIGGIDEATEIIGGNVVI